MADHLLIVEDDETLRTGLCDYFRSQGFDVTDAADGNAGQTALANTDFDLVIRDLMLPGPGGLELLREFRETDTVTPVIILTARASRSRDHHARDDGQHDDRPCD